MTFAHTELLFLVWIVPLLALAFYYGLRKRRSLLGRFADPKALNTLVPLGIAARRRTQAALIVLAAGLLVAAMAGPQVGFEWQTIETEGVDLIIALDCSRSMLAQDIQPTRLDRSKREIIDLLAMLKGDRAGLVAFSGTAFLQCPLTIDHAAFDLFLSVLTPDYLPVGGTDLSVALQTAIEAFDPGTVSDKAIILISDGEHTGSGDPLAAAEAAKNAGIKLFCIGVGSAEGVPVPSAQGGFEKDSSGRIVMSRLDEPTLSKMAQATGGTYVRSVAGDMDLDVIYRDQIQKNMQGTTVQNDRKQVWSDRYQWPLLPAVILFAIALFRPLAPKLLLIALGVGIALGSSATVRAGPLQEGAQAYQNQEYPKALKKMIEGQLAQPDDPRVLYNLGNAYYKNGDFAAAQKHYEQALTQAESESQADKHDEVNTFKSNLLYNLGNTAYRQGSLAAAIEKYKAALALAPNDAQAAENLAFVQKQLENPPQQNNQNSPQDSQKRNQDESRDNSQSGQKSPENQQDQQDKSEPRNQKDEQRQPPEYGNQQEDETPNTAQSQNQQHPQSNQQNESQSARSKGEATPPDPVGATQQLNRLKDEPGRAMMPNYQKRQVEKDW